MRGEDLGPLHGLPITVKDALETKGMRSTGGATELRDHVPTEDAPAVARVKEAGAIVFAKTNAPKWSMNNQTHNELFGVTRNPWDEARSPGGSSGGPAVSVACGFSAFEIGTDIGGSIRMPAHFTGICGHKPSFGIVPSRGYLDHIGGGLTEADINVVGPMARSVADLRLLLGLLAGVDGHRGGGWRLEFPPARPATRLGMWLDDPGCPTDGEVRTILEAAVDLLRADGAAIDVEVAPGRLRGIDEGLLAADLLGHLARPSRRPPRSGPAGRGHPRSSPGEDPLLALGRGPMMRHRDWILVDEHRERLRRQWAAWFTDHDALLCPVGPVAARPLSDQDLMSRKMMVNGTERPANDLIRWPGLIGVAYLPSTVVPVGRTSSGLPIGIQIVGPYLGDLTALRVAERLEALTGGYDPPPLAGDP